MSHRYYELDALRGLAALSVVLFHFLNCFNCVADAVPGDGSLISVIRFSPLHVFFSGSEAVIFFFVLSGFVLYIALDNIRLATCAGFALQRICRIYLPFMAVASLALLLNWLFAFSHVPSLNMVHFNALWARTPNVHDILQHIIFLWRFDETVSVPPSWSLLHELRFSLFFPLIIMWVDGSRPVVAVVSSLLVGAAAAYLDKITFAQYNIFTTLTFTNQFVVGALLAKHREALFLYARGLTRNLKILLIATAILAYSYTAWALPDIRILHRVPINYFFVTLGASLIIVGGGAIGSISRVLCHPVLQYFGKLSYSIYLVHLVVIIPVMHLLYRDNSAMNIALPFIIFAGTVGFAGLSHRYIELPSMKLGREVSKSVQAWILRS